jgi:plastocyanin
VLAGTIITMRRAAVLAAAVVLVAAIPLADAATRTVRIEPEGFRPATITIDLGDTVQWRNSTQRRHQIVAENGAFASPVLRPGETFSVTYSNAGRFRYRDALEPSERGVVVVREPPRAVSATASPSQVVYGSATSVAGTISSRRQGEPVEILAHPHDAPAPTSLGLVTTSAGGAFAFTHTPAILTRYTARWRTTTSQAVEVGVRPRITFRRTSGKKRFFLRVAAGRSYARRWVYLQRRSRLHQWVNVRRIRLGPRSGRIFDLPRRGGKYRIFMTVNQAGPGYMASWSGNQRIRR